MTFVSIIHTLILHELKFNLSYTFLSLHLEKNTLIWSMLINSIALSGHIHRWDAFSFKLSLLLLPFCRPIMFLCTSTQKLIYATSSFILLSAFLLSLFCLFFTLSFSLLLFLLLPLLLLIWPWELFDQWEKFLKYNLVMFF